MFSLRNLTICSALVFTAACGSDSSNNSNNNNGGDSNTLSCPNGAADSSTYAALSGGNVPTCSGQMYTKYGAAFGEVNSAIIGLALNPNTQGLGTSFQTKLANANDARKTEFTNNLAAFLSVAYGATAAQATYSGPDMTTAHGDLAITAAQYNAFIGNVVVPALTQVITAHAGDTNDITNCFAPPVLAPAFTATVVTCK